MTGHEVGGALGCLAEESVFPRLAESRTALRAMAEQVTHGTYGERPFRILLAGGTGVGKSTLLNALANETIAHVGERRPTTAGFTAYVHGRDDDPWLHGLPAVRVVRHERDSLEGKALLDSPDADSAYRDHRAMLEAVLALADLVLVVVTEEKYMSAQVLALLGQFHEGRQFAFVFNKLDLVVDLTVVDDLRRVLRGAGFGDAPVFAISAQAAHRTGPDVSSGDFALLERFINEGLDRARIAGMVRTNLAQRAASAARLVRGSLPEGWERIGETWRQRCDESSAKAFSQLGSTVVRHVLNEDECTAAIAAAQGVALSGVFGLFSAVAYGVRAMGPASSTRPEVLEANLRARMDDVFAVAHGDEVLREGFVLEASRLGLHGGMIRTALAEQVTRGTSQQVVAARLPRCVRDGLAHHSRPPGSWWNALMNLPAWAWVGYWVVRTTSRALQGRSPEWEAFPGAFVILVVALVLEWALVHRILVHRGRRRARLLISSVLTGLEAEVVALHASTIEPALRRVGEQIESIKHVLQTLDDMAQR